MTGARPLNLWSNPGGPIPGEAELVRALRRLRLTEDDLRKARKRAEARTAAFHGHSWNANVGWDRGGREEDS